METYVWALLSPQPLPLTSAWDRRKAFRMCTRALDRGHRVECAIPACVGRMICLNGKMIFQFVDHNLFFAPIPAPTHADLKSAHMFTQMWRESTSSTVQLHNNNHKQPTNNHEHWQDGHKQTANNRKKTGVPPGRVEEQRQGEAQAHRGAQEG